MLVTVGDKRRRDIISKKQLGWREKKGRKERDGLVRETGGRICREQNGKRKKE